MSNSTVGLAREQVVFAVPETTAGTLVFPTSSNAAIVCAGYPSLKQKNNKTDSEEVQDTRDIIDRFTDKAPAADITIPMYLRPSGTLGTRPMGYALFKSLFGTETPNASTSVVYTQAKARPAFSYWAKQGHTVFFCQGAIVTALDVSLATKGGVKMDFTAQGMNMGWAGKDTLDTAISTSTDTVVVDNPKRFTVGARIQNVTKEDTNSNAGYAITAVNYDTGALTVSPNVNGVALAWEAADVIQGFLPEITSYVGTVVENRKGTVSFDGGSTTTAVKEFSLKIGEPVEWLDEVDDNDYPTSYMENTRDISGSIGVYMRPADLERIRDARAGTTKDVRIVFGDTSGYKLQIDMDKVELDVPDVTVNAPAVEMTMDYKALGTSGEDSCSFTFI